MKLLCHVNEDRNTSTEKRATQKHSLETTAHLRERERERERGDRERERDRKRERET